jgi:PAS domain S-box-containing protein
MSLPMTFGVAFLATAAAIRTPNSAVASVLGGRSAVARFSRLLLFIGFAVTVIGALARVGYRSPFGVEELSGLALYFTLVVVTFGAILIAMFHAVIRAEEQREAALQEAKSLAGSLERKVTERTRDLERLLKERERNSLVTEITSNPILVLNSEGCIEWCNPAFFRTFGAVAENTYGRCLMSVLELDPSSEPAARGYLDALRKGQHFKTTFSVARPNGRDLWLSLELEPEAASGSEVQRFGVVLVDVTERHEMEVSLRSDRQKLERIFASLPGAVFEYVLNPDGTSKFTLFSPGLSERYGFVPEIMVSDMELGFLNVIPEDRPAFAAAAEVSARDLSPWVGQFRARTNDGKIGWIQGRSIPRRESSGATCWTGFFYDITELKEAEDRLRQSEALLAFAGSMAKLGGWAYRIGADAPVWTDETYRLHDLEPGSKIDLARALDFYPPEDRERVLAALKLASEQGKPYDLVTRFVTAKGRKLWVRAQGFPVLEDGKVTAVRGIIQDITDLREAEEARRRLEVQLQQSQKLETLGTLAGGIAHDFNNLLTGINGFIDLSLKSVPPDHVVTDYLTQARRGGLAARDLVKRLLLFSRRAPDTARENLELSQLVRDLLPLLTASISTTIQLRTDLAEDTPSIFADPGQVQQLLMNLCVNAAQAIGDRHGSITLSTRSSKLSQEDVRRKGLQCAPGSYALLQVRDTGCGMDRETMERIFDPFYTTRSQGEGTGLGLSIVHGIAHAHGGGIVVESEVGKGSTFEVYFPVAEGKGVRRSEAGETGLLQSTGRKVLLVDDDPTVARFACLALKRLGFSVTGFDSADVAVRHLQEDEPSPALILIDLSMPGMTGLEAIPKIRAIDPELPIILMSGDLERFDASAISRDPKVARLSKPFLISELQEAIAKVFPFS